jgi:hypothetical protein
MTEMDQDVREIAICLVQIASPIARVAEDDADASSEALDLLGRLQRLGLQSLGELEGDAASSFRSDEIRHLGEVKIEHIKQKR